MNEQASIPQCEAKWRHKSLWSLLIGITAQSPAEGLRAFGPGQDLEKERAKGEVRLRGSTRGTGRNPEGRPSVPSGYASGTGRNPEGRPSVPSGSASGTRKTRKANRASPLAPPAERERPERQTERSVWLRQRNAKEKPLPLQQTKLFLRAPPAPPKEGPFHAEFGNGTAAGRSRPSPLLASRLWLQESPSSAAPPSLLSGLLRRLKRFMAVTNPTCTASKTASAALPAASSRTDHRSPPRGVSR